MEFRDIIEGIYPLTITADRYCGTYSGGSFVAWHLDACDVPIEPFAGDVICMEFWDDKSYRFDVGVGNTVEEAVTNLYIKLRGRKRQ